MIDSKIYEIINIYCSNFQIWSDLLKVIDNKTMVFNAVVLWMFPKM